MKKITLYMMMACLTACSYFETVDLTGMLAGSSLGVDERWQQSCSWSDAHPFAVPVKDSTYRVYVMTDSHVDSLRSGDDVAAFVERYHADAQCPLAIHLGDLVSGSEGFERYLSKLPESVSTKHDTLLYTVGNHDLCFGMWSDWQTYFHSSTYCFETTLEGQALDFFICLDTGSGTLGAKQVSWLRTTLEEHPRSQYRYVVVYTHTNLFNSNDMNAISSKLSLEETSLLTDILAQYGVTFVMMGHDHHAESEHFGGVRYEVLTSLKEQMYGLLTMTNDELDWTINALY